ncbi:MAG: hypothetical protein KC729_21885, partial [Candidatus Eisenbacteria bacterium]|nr:hypothetical protein [Candidatus Eisenbacteria bacterium]
REIARRQRHLLPPSISPEGELVKRLVGPVSIPDGFDLCRELIEAVRGERLDLTPNADSGWYDYQLHALVPLIAPDRALESARLELSPSYRCYLEEVVRGIIALSRETHVKQLEIPVVGAGLPEPGIVLEIAPQLSVEPFPSYFRGRAASYRFIREELTKIFGAPALREIHRLTPTGSAARDLSTELAEMEELFDGAAACSEDELGMGLSQAAGADPELGELARSGRARLRAWRRDIEDDPDLGVDARMMVPVFYDLERQQIKVWVFLGWSERPLDIAYARAPRASILDDAGHPRTDVHVEFKGTRRRVPYPVMAEVYVTRLLDRSELRAHCDRWQSAEAILSHLE